MTKLSNETASGNIYMRKMRKSKGEVVEGHTHNFDHTSIFFTGSFHVKAKLPNGTVVEQDFTAPAHALIRKDVEHEITCLSDEGEFWCVYSHRSPQGDIVQEWNGWDNVAYV